MKVASIVRSEGVLALVLISSADLEVLCDRCYVVWLYNLSSRQHNDSCKHARYCSRKHESRSLASFWPGSQPFFQAQRPKGLNEMTHLE
jgi:hypothetical protein